MGEPVTTLEDLLRSGLRAVCVGINPSPRSVEVGHYYQGRLGQLFFKRLRAAGVLPARLSGYEDDHAFAAGIGFTDIVKRPTARAAELTAEEFDHGRELLRARLVTYQPRLIIFTYKKTAEVLFGQFSGNGFVPGVEIAGAQGFVMPGPYENAQTAAQTLQQLASRFLET